MSKKEQSTGANIFKLEKQKGSKYYSMRIMLRGKRRRFSTGKSSVKEAKLKARIIMADIQSRGFDAAIKVHSKRRDEIPAAEPMLLNGSDHSTSRLPLKFPRSRLVLFPSP